MESNETVTEEQIEAWKAKFGEVHEIEVSLDPIEFEPLMLPSDELGENTISCFLKKPDKRMLNYALTLISDPAKAGEAILKNCWLGGDDRIKTEPGLLQAASYEALKFLKIHEARSKKR